MTRTRDRATASRALPLVAFVALLTLGSVVSGCRSGEETDPVASREPSPSASSSAGAPTGSPEASPDDSPPPSNGPGSTSSAAAALAARIPTTVDGETLTVTAASAADLSGTLAAAAFAGGERLEPWLTERGKTWADVVYATATTEALIPLGGRKVAILTALQVRGASATELLDWFGISGIAGIGEADRTAIGGREVVSWWSQELDLSVIVFAAGDTIFYLAQASPRPFAEAIIAAIR